MFIVDPAAAPLARLLHAYDQAIAACREQRALAAYRTITLLREAHPCDSPAAAGFDGIYAWCERAVGSGDYLGAAKALGQLRGAWEAADRITSPPPTVMNVTTPTRIPSANDSLDASA